MSQNQLPKNDFTNRLNKSKTAEIRYSFSEATLVVNREKTNLPWFLTCPVVWAVYFRVSSHNEWFYSAKGPRDIAELNGQTFGPVVSWSPEILVNFWKLFWCFFKYFRQKVFNCFRWLPGIGSFWSAHRDSSRAAQTSCKRGFESWSSPACAPNSYCCPCPKNVEMNDDFRAL